MVNEFGQMCIPTEPPPQSTYICINPKNLLCVPFQPTPSLFLTQAAAGLSSVTTPYFCPFWGFIQTES